MPMWERLATVGSSSTKKPLNDDKLAERLKDVVKEAKELLEAACKTNNEAVVSETPVVSESEPEPEENAESTETDNIISGSRVNIKTKYDETRKEFTVIIRGTPDNERRYENILIKKEMNNEDSLYYTIFHDETYYKKSVKKQNIDEMHKIITDYLDTIQGRILVKPIKRIIHVTYKNNTEDFLLDDQDGEEFLTGIKIRFNIKETDMPILKRNDDNEYIFNDLTDDDEIIVTLEKNEDPVKEKKIKVSYSNVEKSLKVGNNEQISSLKKKISEILNFFPPGKNMKISFAPNGENISDNGDISTIGDNATVYVYVDEDDANSDDSDEEEAALPAAEVASAAAETPAAEEAASAAEEAAAVATAVETATQAAERATNAKKKAKPEAAAAAAAAAAELPTLAEGGKSRTRRNKKQLKRTGKRKTSRSRIMRKTRRNRNRMR